MGEKNPRWALGLLLALGWLGAHRFYLGRYASALAQLALAALCAALWLWGGGYVRIAPYLLGPIAFCWLRDGFWLFDYFRVEENMDSRLSAFAQSQLEQQAAPAPSATSPMAPKAAPVPMPTPAPVMTAPALPAAPTAAAAAPAQAPPEKKSLVIQMAQQHIAEALAQKDAQAANAEAADLVKYLQQRSPKPQSDPHLAMAYLLQGMTFYQTQYLDAARKKLQMGVHLGAAFPRLAQPVQHAQACLQRLRTPAAQTGAAALSALQPGQYPLLMQSGDWAQALALCEQTIALRQSAKTWDLPDLARHRLHAMEIAQQTGDAERQQAHGRALLALAERDAAALPAALQRQALERLGDLSQSQADHQRASHYYGRALVLAQAQIQAEASADAAGASGAGLAMLSLCALLQRMALNHEQAGEPALALQCWQRLVRYVGKMDALDQQGQRMPDPEAISDLLTRCAAFSIRHQPTRVKPLVQQALGIQQRAYRGYSMAAARAYEVFAEFLAAHGQADARQAYLKKALLLVQICDPDNADQLRRLKIAIQETA